MKPILLSLLVALLGGCATTAPAPAPTPPPHFDHSYTARSQSSRVKFIILHYTVSDLPRSLKILTEQAVSSHYLLSDTAQPVFYTLVDESRQSNHAGVSNWKNYTLLNTSSIGIEIVNPGFRETAEGRLWYPFPQAQMDELIPLLKQIVARHNIPPENILGHNEIAPQRKQDPGPMFPWHQLAAAGLITWPEPSRVAAQRALYELQLPDIAWFQARLSQHGYAVPRTGELDEETRNVISAFQMKYRQSSFAGVADAETAAILDVLTSPLPPIPPVPAPPAAPASAEPPVAVK